MSLLAKRSQNFVLFLPSDRGTHTMEWIGEMRRSFMKIPMIKIFGLLCYVQYFGET